MSVLASLRFARAVGLTLGHSVGVLAASARGTLTREDSSRRYWNWCEALCRLGGVDLHVEGLDALPPDRGWLFMSNHRSYWDIPSIGFGLKPVPLRMLAKSDLFKVPLWGPAMRQAEILPLNPASTSSRPCPAPASRPSCARMLPTPLPAQPIRPASSWSAAGG